MAYMEARKGEAGNMGKVDGYRLRRNILLNREDRPQMEHRRGLVLGS